MTTTEPADAQLPAGYRKIGHLTENGMVPAEEPARPVMTLDDYLAVLGPDGVLGGPVRAPEAPPLIRPGLDPEPHRSRTLWDGYGRDWVYQDRRGTGYGWALKGSTRRLHWADMGPYGPFQVAPEH